MTSKPTSRWNFLQHAVASVESKLDTILAEENDPLRRSATPLQTSRDTAPAKRMSSELSRSSSNASTSNDRLQERLARAMAKKNANRSETPPIAIEQSPTRAPKDDAPVSSSEHTKLEHDSGIEGSQAEGTSRATEDAGLGPHHDSTVSDEDGVKVSELESSVSTAGPAAISTEGTGDGRTLSGKNSQDIPRKTDEAPVRSETEETEKIKEETGIYIERIDALQAKLQYLSKEAALSSKQAAASADTGSLERKLAEKDEKIALLIEEGTRLSKSEMAYLTAVKRLKVQLAAKHKEQEAMKIRAERAERSLKAMEDRASKAEAASKKAEQQLVTSMRASSDLEAIKRERDALHATLAEMKAQLSKANSRAEAAESKAQSDEVEKERRRITELQDDLTSARLEREISDDKFRREIDHLQATLEKEKEQSRAMESEMLNEQAALESKLESFRVRAEEAASTDQRHQQAKLLRQIETIQSQYATASQNWQGIESTLLGRITNLEKERDEVAARDTDLRKKFRDVSLKLKSAERELESVQTKYDDMEKSLTEANGEMERLDRKARQLEADLATALKEVEEQKSNAARELKRKVEEEKARWTATLHIQRIESPTTSSRKNSSMASDINHLMSPVQYERPSSRRSSAMPGFDSNGSLPQQSSASFRGIASNSVPETPSVVTSMDQEEYFANIPPTPLSASHHSHRGVNDLISASTVGAGPSVQLVERMSANVRRLESEKAASKDELLRIATQRDEARQEVVSLMREVEEKRKVEARLNSLEKEYKNLSERHQTTLELLGEKSELVEELKADILDVKQMYRQLVDTLK